MAQERRAKGCGRAETIAESATHALDLNARRVAAHVASFVLYNHWKKDRHFSGSSDAARWPLPVVRFGPRSRLLLSGTVVLFSNSTRSGARRAARRHFPMAASVRNAPS